MRISWDDILEKVLKTVRRSAMQWSAVKIMTDFCLVGNSPGSQLGIWPEGELAPCSRAHFWLRQDPRAKVYQNYNDKFIASCTFLQQSNTWWNFLHGCISWRVAYRMAAHSLASFMEVLIGQTGLQATQPVLSRDICLGYSAASPRTDLHFYRYLWYGSQERKGMWNSS